MLQNYSISLEIIHSIINHQLLPGNMRKMSFCPNDHTVPVFGILDNVQSFGQNKIRYPLVLVGIYFIMSKFISKIEIAVKF